MASMWNLRLAAMLMVGRKTRLLIVGRRSLATSDPIGSWIKITGELEGILLFRGMEPLKKSVTKLVREDSEGQHGATVNGSKECCDNSCGECALKFKCPDAGFVLGDVSK